MASSTKYHVGEIYINNRGQLVQFDGTDERTEAALTKDILKSQLTPRNTSVSAMGSPVMYQVGERYINKRGQPVQFDGTDDRIEAASTKAKDALEDRQTSRNTSTAAMGTSIKHEAKEPDHEEELLISFDTDAGPEAALTQDALEDQRAPRDPEHQSDLSNVPKYTSNIFGTTDMFSMLSVSDAASAKSYQQREQQASTWDSFGIATGMEDIESFLQNMPSTAISRSTLQEPGAVTGKENIPWSAKSTRTESPKHAISQDTSDNTPGTLWPEFPEDLQIGFPTGTSGPLVLHHALQTSFPPIREMQLEDLAKKHSIKGAGEHLRGPNSYVYDYLLSRDSEFQRVAELRAKGWRNEVGDEIFIDARQRSDNTGPDGERIIFRKMQEIGQELHQFALIYAPATAVGRPLKVLDICMAPGGYSAVALQYDPNAEVYGITLPEGGTMCGHEVVGEVKRRMRGIKFCDLTMFAGEFAKLPIPKDHPDYKNFTPMRPFKGHTFDLVFCDGNVLRNHQRPEYRKERDQERVRLNCSQLILGMQRIIPGGNLVMLLQKVDFWDTVYLVWQFSKFAEVSLLKSRRSFKTKGSFYLIAQNVQPEHPKAQEAVAEWKDDWWRATCGDENGPGEPRFEHDEAFVKKVLEEFGDQLIEMARPVWKIQADALEQSEYAGNGSYRNHGRERNSPAKKF